MLKGQIESSQRDVEPPNVDAYGHPWQYRSDQSPIQQVECQSEPHDDRRWQDTTGPRQQE